MQNPTHDLPVFSWNEEKNRILKETRNISFEEVVDAIKNEEILADISNPSRNYERQRCYVVRVRDYAYAVPYIQNENVIFLKTIFPNRNYKNLLNK